MRLLQYLVEEGRLSRADIDRLRKLSTELDKTNENGRRDLQRTNPI